MEAHTTEALKTETSIPAKMRNMTADQIVVALQKTFDPGWNTPAGEEPKAANPESAMLVSAFDTFRDPAHWKNPFYARFPKDADGRDASEWVKAAAIWYHGAKPYQTFVGVGSRGYAC